MEAKTAKAKFYNPIYLDSSSSDEDDVETQKPLSTTTTLSKNKAPDKDVNENALIKRYSFDNVKKSPLAPLSTATGLSISSGVKMNFDNFEEALKQDATYQASLSKLNGHINKLSMSPQKPVILSLSPVKPKAIEKSTLNVSNGSSSQDSFDILVSQTQKKNPTLKIEQPSNSDQLTPDSISSNFASSVKKEQDVSSPVVQPAPTVKPKLKIVFNNSLVDYLRDLGRYDIDISKSSFGQQNEVLLKSTMESYKSRYIELMEKYCEVIDQIPAVHFNEIDGFEANTFLKLKVMRQKFKARTQLLERQIERQKREREAQADECDFDAMERDEREMQAELKQIQGQTPSSYAPEPSADQNEEKPSDIELNTKPSTSKTNTSYTNGPPDDLDELVPVSSPHEGYDDDDYLAQSMRLDDEEIYSSTQYGVTIVQPVQSTRSLPQSYGDSDDDFEDTLKQIREEHEALQGRKSQYNNYAYADFEAVKQPTSKKMRTLHSVLIFLTENRLQLIWTMMAFQSTIQRFLSRRMLMQLPALI